MTEPEVDELVSRLKVLLEGREPDVLRTRLHAIVAALEDLVADGSGRRMAVEFLGRGRRVQAVEVIFPRRIG